MKVCFEYMDGVYVMECDKYMWYIWICIYIYTYGKNGMTRIPYLCEIRVQVRKAYVYDSCDPCVT